MSLKVKFNIFVTAILSFTVISIVLSCNLFIEDKQKTEFIESLKRTSLVYSSIIEEKRRSIVNQSELVGVLPILTSVVDDGDKNTVLDIGKGYQKDLNSQIFDIYDVDGELLASINNDINEEKEVDNQDYIIDVIDEGESFSNFVIRNNKIALLGVVPIGLKDDPSGALVAGMYLDDNFAKSIEELTGVEVNFILDKQIVGSSYDVTEKKRIIDNLSNLNTQQESIYESTNDIYNSIPLQNDEGELIGSIILVKSMGQLQILLKEIRYYLLSVSLIIFVLSIAFGILYAKNLTKPILEAVTFASDLANGKLDHEITVQRNDELGELQSSLDKMRVSLKDLIENLDHKVQEKTRDISLILENIPNPLLTFTMDGKIGSEYSTRTESYFGNKISGTNAGKLLFKDETTEAAFVDWFDFLPLSPMPYEDTVGLAPNEIKISTDQGEKELVLNYVPIYKDGTSDYEKLMLLCKDVTEERILSAEMIIKEAKTEFILKVLKSKEGYTNYLKECSRCIDDLMLICKDLKGENALEKVTQAFRSAHTIKGNSGAYGVTEIKDAADELESALMKGRDGEVELNSDYEKNILSLLPKLLESFEKHVKETEILFNDTFDPKSKIEKSYNIKDSQIEKLLTLARKNSSNILEEIENLKLKEINVFLTPYIDQVSALAERLEKKVNPLIIKGGEVLVDTDILNPLFAAFVHMIRNSVDHGIETIDERTESKKEEFATITISVENNKEELIITVEDDGKGINPAIIKNIALEKGLKTETELKSMSDKEIQLLIFAAGFSTKTEVTSTSGRGVGMDAVKFEVEKLGGKIDINSVVGRGSTFILHIPKNGLNNKNETNPHSNRLLKREPLARALQATYSDSTNAGKIVDISMDGMLLISKNKHKINENITLSLSSDDPNHDDLGLIIEVNVRRCKEVTGKYEIGCQFSEELTQEQESIIRKITLEHSGIH